MNKRNSSGLVTVIICNIVAWPNAFLYFYLNSPDTINMRNAWFILGAAILCGICLIFSLIQYFSDGTKRG
ncbi:hypothetical protein BRUR0010001c01_00031 [Bifidobacterium phage BlindUri1]|nr:hypothetical protein BRUR0010001c01_00031 [Bifidobacterium phage BlindUri1]